MTKKYVVSVRVNESDGQMLDELSDKYGITQSEVIRCAVKYLYKHKANFDGLYHHI